jgi:L-ascorbate metabolism protein UlaG (beta-lactamase superfamily)
MALIEELPKPDIGIVPIGDRLTMGGAVAALACRRYFNFAKAIPCHYGSFPIIDQTAEKFVEGLKGASQSARDARAHNIFRRRYPMTIECMSKGNF